MCVTCGNMYHVSKGGSDAVGAVGTAFGTSASLPTYSIPQVADYLINGFWEDNGFSGFKFDVAAGGTLTYSVAGLDAEGAWFAEKALEAWSIVSGIQFVSNGTASADIVFMQNDPYGSGAYAWSTYESPGIIDQSFVNVSTSWYAGDEGEIHSYSFQTYVHEIGHALGLGHAGNYNGSANFNQQAVFGNDSWQMSVMSYFAQTENPNTNASFAYLLGPMVADIYAIQKMYGKSTTANVGNTTWGYGSNAEGEYSQFVSHNSGSPGAAMTVFDTGGEDTFDFSQSGYNQKIDLRQQKASDVLGYKGNLLVAVGTTIENAQGGSGNDVIYGNWVDNTLIGNNGNDRLVGGSGNDTLIGGNGRDRLEGGAGTDYADYTFETTAVTVNLLANTGYRAAYGDTFFSIEGVYGGSAGDSIKGNNIGNRLYGNDGDDTLVGRQGWDRLYGDEGNDRLMGGNGSDRLYGGQGNDRLTGGDGADRFYYDDGVDRIMDFNDNENDRIFIDQDDVPAGMSVWQLMRNNSTVINGDVHIDLGNGNKLIIEDVSNKMSLVDDIQFY